MGNEAIYYINKIRKAPGAGQFFRLSGLLLCRNILIYVVGCRQVRAPSAVFSFLYGNMDLKKNGRIYFTHDFKMPTRKKASWIPLLGVVFHILYYKKKVQIIFYRIIFI